MRENQRFPSLFSSEGSLQVITGPMFSGKSDELIERLELIKNTLEIMQRKNRIEGDISELIKVFKPSVDTRRGINSVNTEDGKTFPATPINRVKDVLKLVTEKTTIVAFDESQFWNKKDLIKTCRELAKEGKKVIVAGLSLDFKADEWGGVGQLASEADTVTRLSAVCTTCGEDAPYSQRIVEEDINGEKVRRPAFSDEPIEVVGGTNLYEARCRIHHEVPRKI